MTIDAMPSVRSMAGGSETAEDLRRIGALLASVDADGAQTPGRRVVGGMMLEAARTAGNTGDER